MLHVQRNATGNSSGVSTLLFAGSAFAFMGTVGLGTEVGSWYLAKRHGQNAADSAAIAGALMLADTNSSSTARSSAAGMATQNGYTSGSGGVIVTASNPPSSGAYAGNNKYVQVTISQTATPHFAAPFISGGVTITTRAVAGVISRGPACGLAFNQLTLSGSTNVNMPGCTLTSNGTSSTAINIGGSASLTANSLVSSGGCSGCSSSGVSLSSPYSAYQPATTDPFSAIQSVSLPGPFSGSSCGVDLQTFTVTGTVSSPTTLTPYASASGSTAGPTYGKAICGGNGGGANTVLSVSAGNYLSFTPGTYILWNASLKFNGGVIQCPLCTGSQGVTIILTGSPASKIGTIDINGNATVTLTAPTSNNWNHSFDKVLFYMDKNAPASNGGGNPPVQINGGPNTVLSGGMYFPSVSASFSGNETASGGSASTCTDLVANNITFNGNSKLDITGCASSIIPTAQAVRLVE